MVAWKVDRCSEVVPTSLQWLWPNYLTRGKLTILDGDPGLGKSLMAIDLIARLSRGGPLPDGAPLSRPCNSILLSAEDEPGDTIRPRAEAAGADLTRLFLPRFDGRVPRLPDDLPALEELVRDCRADLIVLDPLMAFLPPQVAANLDQCVRQALTPLAALAARNDCSMLLIRHLSKAGRDQAIYRGQGSMGIMAAVRTGLLAARFPRMADAGQPHEGTGSKSAPVGNDGSPAVAPTGVLGVAKSNVARRPPALGYRIATSASGLPVIEWTGRVDLSVDDLCRHRRVAELKTRDRVVDWLKRELANGPRKAADIYAAAAAAGIPEATLKRAKAELPAESHRTYDHRESRGEWYWYDPDAPWPKTAPFKKPYELPPLDPLGDL